VIKWWEPRFSGIWAQIVRDVDRRLYEPYIRHRHTVPSAVPVDVWSYDYRNRYTAGCQPYFAVLRRPFTAVIRASIFEIILREF